MAKRNLKEQGTHAGGEEAEAPSGLQEALIYVKQNPTKVAGGAGFLLLCVAVGGLFSLKNMAEDRKADTQYAAALETEDP
ncbi:MAG: hypothetical protein L3K26_17290, partial [Candidatus Hydrogenedentes bacterium]|nr:hypothetical protein [Candidatus Hydrogenedentota bacterium]